MNTSRLKALRRLLKTNRCTHILVSDVVDVRYISGFNSSNAFLLVSAGEQSLLTDFRYKEAAERFFAADRRWSVVEIKESSFSFLKPLMPVGSVLGLQSGSLTVDQFDRIRAALPRTTFVKLSEAVGAISVAKTPRELSVIGRCARIGDAALKRTISGLKLGMTEKDAAGLLEQHCKILGSERPGFETIALFGPRSALPHGVPSGRRLKRGDFVLFDFGCAIAGLCSDMTRTLVAGRASDRQKRIYATVLKAQSAGRAAIRRGMRCSQADGVVRSIITNAGYGEYFGHATGHGVGYRIHEQPRVASTSTQILPRDAIVTVEPGIYIPHVGGVRIEDMVYLASHGAKVLTHFPRKLIELPL
jgi:Xaa-Pro aminopeptidase